MKEFIPYGCQDISEKDIEAVIKVLKSDFITQGPYVERFEQDISNYVGSKHSVSFNSATSALHSLCLAMNLGAGDFLWTSPISFVASSNCALYCGAEVDFVDIDPLSFNLCPDKLEVKLQLAEKSNCLPKILVVVHMGGASAEMLKISRLAKKYNFKVIEDASHALGGEYESKKIGACQYSDACVFSFHPVKMITSGEGGLCTTNDTELFEAMQLFRSHGITKDLSKFIKEPEGAWYYEQQKLGFNYRMTDIHAALGSSQLQRLDQFLKIRNEWALRYKEELGDLGIGMQSFSDELYSSYHLFLIQLKSPEQRDSIFAAMRAERIGVNVHYIPIFLQPYYQRMGKYSEQDFPNAMNYYKHCLSLPMHTKLDDEKFSRVLDLLKINLS